MSKGRHELGLHKLDIVLLAYMTGKFPRKENEPQCDKTNCVACAPSEDSDQSGYPPSLIKVFTVRMKKAGVLSYALSTQRSL